MSTLFHPSALRAVITADLVNSSSRLRSTERAAFAEELEAAYTSLQERLSAELPYALALFAGDSWQCYVSDPHVAFRVALYLRAWTRTRFNVDTRFALSVDTVEFVSERNIGESDGAAFRISGRLVRSLNEGDRIALAVLQEHKDLPNSTHQLLRTASGAVACLADQIAQTWTVAQAQALMWRLRDPDVTHEEIRSHWQNEPVTRQAITKHLQRGGWRNLSRALQYFEQMVASVASIELLQSTNLSEPK